MKKSLIVGVALASAFLLYYAFYNMPAEIFKKHSDYKNPSALVSQGATGATTLTRQIQTGATVIAVEVADSDTARERGLSGRAGLKEGAGMLFVFEEDEAWRFWTKDMQFPIDIIFLAETGRVVSIEADVSPSTYPEVFYPPTPVHYVLELPAGFAQAHDITTGSTFDLGL